ncbi:hypothetical protein V5N11_022568 [Cardamine amara subsp. amara]|uniref:Uncharacterized protein n=1 Tax=Cardamine amara subsp. amara TaxID=228776 RepID=A0ABD1AQA2_CARAN
MERVRRLVRDLEGDPNGQKTWLRLETSPIVTTDINKEKGHVFEFLKQSEVIESGEKLLAAAFKAGAVTGNQLKGQGKEMSLSDRYQTGLSGSTIYHTGSSGASSSGAKQPMLRYRRMPSKWKRIQNQQKSAVVYKEKQQDVKEADTTLKRKACEEEALETASKVAKRNELEVVPHEEPPKQV